MLSLTRAAEQQSCCNRLTGRERERETGKRGAFLLYTSCPCSQQWPIRGSWTRAAPRWRRPALRPGLAPLPLLAAVGRGTAPLRAPQPRAKGEEGGQRARETGEVSFHFLSGFHLVWRLRLLLLPFHGLPAEEPLHALTGPCSLPFRVLLRSIHCTLPTLRWLQRQ